MPKTIIFSNQQLITIHRKLQTKKSFMIKINRNNNVTIRPTTGSANIEISTIDIHEEGTNATKSQKRINMIVIH